MEEQQEHKPQNPREYWEGFPEAPFSTTFKWIDANGFEQMTTIRGWAFLPMFETVKKAEAVILENGGNSPAKYQAAAHASDTVPNLPDTNTGEIKYKPVDESGNDLPDVKTCVAGRLSVEMKDSKYFYKVMDATFKPGAKGTKYGISVYPEVLAAANLDVTPGQPVPNIAGWRVDYIENEKGYPWKVTRLLPSKQ